MRSGKRTIAAGLLALGLLGVSACGEDGCEPELVRRASDFIDAHQSCERDEDCFVVGDFCGQIPGGFCGQVTMNRTGVMSDEWRSLTGELTDCSPDVCPVCDAALTPSCNAGSCRTPR